MRVLKGNFSAVAKGFSFRLVLNPSRFAKNQELRVVGLIDLLAII
jgi:hypothetical protein